MDIMIFVFGMVFGIIAMAFLFTLNSVHQSFHEIEWHDAQKEKPSEYIVPGQNFIHLLIHNKNGAIIDANYYVDDESLDYEAWGNVTHFAYIDELKRTIPPCPVCCDIVATNHITPYAFPGSL